MQPGSDDRPNACMQHAYKRQGKRACGESEKTQAGIKEKEPMTPCVLRAIHFSRSLHAGVKLSKIMHGVVCLVCVRRVIRKLKKNGGSILATKDINIPCMHAEVRRLVCMALH